jgi:hypothetical protein
MQTVASRDSRDQEMLRGFPAISQPCHSFFLVLFWRRRQQRRRQQPCRRTSKEPEDAENMIYYQIVQKKFIYLKVTDFK